MKKAFLVGLFAVLPLVVTVYLLYWFCSAIEAVIGGGLRWVLPEGWYVPGMGLVIGIVSIFIIGWMLRLYIMARLWRFVERLIERVPVVSSVYTATRDVSQFLSGSSGQDASQVVLLEIEQLSCSVVGLLTREDFESLKDDFGDKDTVAVYVPMSYQIGGFTLMVQRSRVRPLEMTVEEALRFALTAGVTTQKADKSELSSRQ